MLKFNFKKKNISKGFTLLEALVATSILMVAVAAPITIAQKGLSSAVYSKNQMIASYLAQDAIEYIKNVRDQVAINHNLNNADKAFDWEGLSVLDACKESVGCQVDTIKDFTDVNGGAIESAAILETLYKDEVNGFYGYDDTGDKTNFTRIINIQVNKIEDRDDEALVTATVNWNGGEVVVKTLIYNI